MRAEALLDRLKRAEAELDNTRLDYKKACQSLDSAEAEIGRLRVEVAEIRTACQLALDELRRAVRYPLRSTWGVMTKVAEALTKGEL